VKIGTRFLSASIALLVLGCNGQDSTGPNPLHGSYTLQALNGSALPASVTLNNGFVRRALSGSLEIYADKTFLSVTSLVDSTGAGETAYTETIEGTWYGGGASIALTSSDIGKVTGTVYEDGTLVLNRGAFLLYRKNSTDTQ
jgi:hypothetical protein